MTFHRKLLPQPPHNETRLTDAPSPHCKADAAWKVGLADCWKLAGSSLLLLFPIISADVYRGQLGVFPNQFTPVALVRKT